jgi:hypothetical protein
VNRARLIVLSALCANPLLAQAPPPTPPPKPCLTQPESRQLDFWIGDWEVARTGQPVPPQPSRSHIASTDDGCVITEQYTTPIGYTGRSLNAYDAVKKQWEQFWVDSAGGLHHYVGHARDGNMYYEAQILAAGESRPTRNRMTFFNQGNDQVRQLGEQSKDDGKTWTVSYDLTYRRRPGSPQ